MKLSPSDWFPNPNNRAVEKLLNQMEHEVENLISKDHLVNQCYDKKKKLLSSFKDRGDIRIVNSDKNLPIFESKDLLNSIFEARKRGICTWDNTISNFIDSDELDDVTRNFLKTDPGENFHVDSEKTEISALETIVKKLSPCLVVIPGGSEYDTTVQSHTFFKEMGVEDDQMSVMFRLPTDTHEIFNKFVKNNNLNNPITEKTKVVFVSSKLPKPVLKSKIKFHCVLNMGFSNVHYSMKDFVGKHENLVFFSKKKDQRNRNFAFL